MSRKSREAALGGNIVRWLVLPSVGVGIVLWSFGMVASVSSMGTSLASASTVLPQSLNTPATAAFPQSVTGAGNATTSRVAQAGRGERVATQALPVTPTVVQEGKSVRLAAGVERRFDRIVADAGLSHDKLAAAFARVRKVERELVNIPAPAQDRFGGAPADVDGSSNEAGPAPERFAPRVAGAEKSTQLALALVEPAGAATSGVAAVTQFAVPSVDDGYDGQPFGLTDVPSLYEGTPDSTPVPSRRPRSDPDQVDQRQAGEERDAAPRQENAPASKPPKRSDRSTSAVLAYARPDNPNAGQAFRNLFGAPKPSSGVAVYDISAKTVYMPDGTKLEAHSGIGAMADNPRYAHKKMNGPTPPHTYKLSMRESRFYGVEAIRLTPIDGKNKYGRTGLLAHSYLLRGGRAESHGCVAFKDYQRFLSAFKKGKIKRLVVVSGRSKGPARVASNGRDV